MGKTRERRAGDEVEGEIGAVVELRIEGNPRGDDLLAVTKAGGLEAPPWDFLLDAKTIVIRHDEDPTKDIRLAVTPRVNMYRVRFDFADERFADIRALDSMEGYSKAYLVVPDYTFKAEVHGDTRLDEANKGRRTLIPLHPLGEVQGPYGEVGPDDTYHPHPAELLVMGLRGPMPTLDGAQLVANRLTRDGSPPTLLLLVMLVFALSTIVGWAELGGRAATAVAGGLGAPVLKVGMLIAAAVGTTWSLEQLLPVVDLTLAAVVVPSVLGLVLLLPKVRAASTMTDDIQPAEPAADEQ